MINNDSSNSIKMSISRNFKMDLRNSYSLLQHKSWKFGEPKAYANPRRAKVIKFIKNRLRRMNRRNPFNSPREEKWPFT